MVPQHTNTDSSSTAPIRNPVDIQKEISRVGGMGEVQRVARIMRLTKTIKDRLQFALANDSRAQAVFKKLLHADISQRDVILILEASSDPNLGKRLRRLLPTREEGERLIRSMHDTAGEIRSFWKPGLFSLVLFPYSQAAHSAADVLDEQAKVLREIRWSLLTKRMGFRSFWSQFPIAILCAAFDVPRLVTYTELSHLLNAASRVRHSFGKDMLAPASSTPRALRQTYIRFRHRNERFVNSGGLESWVSVLKLLIASIR